MFSLSLLATTSSYGMEGDPLIPPKVNPSITKEEKEQRFQEVLGGFSNIANQFKEKHGDGEKAAEILTKFNKEHHLTIGIEDGVKHYTNGMGLSNFAIDLVKLFLSDANDFAIPEKLQQWVSNLRNSVDNGTLKYLKETFNNSNFVHLYNGAQRLLEIVKNNKMHFLLLPGRSSDAMGHILSSLINENGKNQTLPFCMVNLPLSGCADVLPKDAHEKDPEAKNIRGDCLFNLVKKNRLEGFFTVCDYLELYKMAGKKAGIVDYVSSGAGMNSLLKLLEGYFYWKDLPFPKISIVSLGYLEHEKERQIKETTVSEICVMTAPEKTIYTSNDETITFSKKNPNFILRGAKELKQETYPVYPLRINPSAVHACDVHPIQFLQDNTHHIFQTLGLVCQTQMRKAYLKYLKADFTKTFLKRPLNFFVDI